jgi:ribosomal protein L11 methyltransferase
MNYCKASFYTSDISLRERLIAILDEAGFTAFEETDEALLAYIPEAERGSIDLDSILPEPVRREEDIIEPQNWNAVWESSFEPVTVPGFCTVRAAFHPANPGSEHDIIITPKMSFGTGHHATTRLMMAAMQGMDFRDKRVLDFGTGTGILAILAGKLGASEVLAIDNDPWSVENAEENVAANGVGGVTVALGSLEAAAGRHYDYILANINRHILLQYMKDMRALLQPGGILQLSGILAADEEIISESAVNTGLTKRGLLSEAEWIALTFTA